jgi:long-chain acyl-CoA synthetase
LVEHVVANVAKFKAPSRVHFLPSLPKGGIGKILRRELRDKAASLRNAPVAQAQS